MRSTPLTRISLALIPLVGFTLTAPRAFAEVPQTPSSPQDAQQAPQPQPAQTPQDQPQPQAAAAAASAQAARHAVDPIKARYNVQVMEAVLERAVRYAAGQMNRRLQAVSPDLLQLSGAARARGFRLPGYGVFFDVDVPAALRHTMGWTLRLMQQSDQNAQRALAVIRQSLAEMDPKQRAQTEVALKLLEARFQPPPRPRPMFSDQDRPANADAGTSDAPATSEATTTAAETVIAASATGAPPSIAPLATATAAGGATAVNTGTPLTTVPTPDPASSPVESAPTPAPAPSEPAPTADDLAWAQNPDLAYEMEVRDALVSAMLEYGSTLSLGTDECLTIAARDSENVVMPGDLSETVTVLLRIKGSDLHDYKSGRITEAEARRRIEVREF